MSTEVTFQIASSSLEDTLKIASKMGSLLEGGEVIQLIGDLGAGKTAFVRGLAAGMGSEDEVASPSFTISREYNAGNLQLHHFDFYRLDDPGIVAAELSESINDQEVVVAVEWGDSVSEVIPESAIRINIQSPNENEREFTMTTKEGTKAAETLRSMQ